MDHTDHFALTRQMFLSNSATVLCQRPFSRTLSSHGVPEGLQMLTHLIPWIALEGMSWQREQDDHRNTSKSQKTWIWRSGGCLKKNAALAWTLTLCLGHEGVSPCKNWACQEHGVRSHKHQHSKRTLQHRPSWNLMNLQDSAARQV